MMRNFTLPAAAAVLTAAWCVVDGQEVREAAFEVASVRVAQPRQGSGGGAICLTPCYGERIAVEHDRVDISTITLGRLMVEAFRIRPFQLSGPGWLTDLGNGTRFDIQAKMPAGASKDQVPAMLQALLADRFKLAVHRESRELPVYALVAGKDGPRLKAAEEADALVADGSVGRSLYSPQGRPMT